MIFGKHQLQRGFGIFVIQHQCLFIGHIGSFGITKFQLYQPYNSIVDNSYEFRTDAFVYQSHPFRFNTSDTVGFDEYLICYGRRTKNAPRRTVIMKFLREQVTANRNDMFKLLLGIFHFLFSQCAAKIGIIKESTLFYRDCLRFYEQRNTCPGLRIVLRVILFSLQSLSMEVP